jgi:hypothetical protein
MKSILGARFISYTRLKEFAAADTHDGKKDIPVGAAVGLHETVAYLVLSGTRRPRSAGGSDVRQGQATMSKLSSRVIGCAAGRGSRHIAKCK